MGEYVLEPSESIVIKTKGVCKKVAGEGLKGLLSSNQIKGDLILTSENVVFTYETGALVKTKASEVHSLSGLKVYNGLAQVKAEKPRASGDCIPLEFYFDGEPTAFLFDPAEKKAVCDWVETVNELLTGVRCGFDIEDIGGNKVGRAITEALEQAKPIAASAADVVKPIASVAAVAAMAKGGAKGKIAGAVLDAIDVLSGGEASVDIQNSELEERARDESSANESSVLSLDEQIEALQKLKGLVDMGILSEEEFDAKKKQILGL